MKKGFTFWFFGKISWFQAPLIGYQKTIAYPESTKETLTISKLFSFLISFIKYGGLGIKYSQKVINTFIKAIAFKAKAITYGAKVITYGAKAITSDLLS